MLSLPSLAIATEYLPAGVRKLYDFKPARVEACDAVGERIAAGTFEAAGLSSLGIDKNFRNQVNSSHDSSLIYEEVKNISPLVAGRARAGGLPWMMFNSPNPAAKRAAMQFQMQSAWNLVTERKQGATANFLPLRFERLADLLRSHLEEVAEKSEKLNKKPVLTALPKRDYSIDLQGAVKSGEIGALCLKAFPMYSETCFGPFVDSARKYAPKFYANDNGQFYWMLDSVMKSVFRDPGYHRGLMRAAVLILKRIQKAEATGSVSSSIMNDLYTVFLEVSPKDSSLAMTRTWRTLAAYATQGASFGILEPFVDKESTDRLIALEVISAGMSYLDAFAEMDEQGYYSLPPFLSGGCRLTKPYHFWLLAYNARQAVAARKRKPASAAVESHMLGYLYDIGSKTNGRDDLSTLFSSDGQYGVLADSLRLSILSKDLGTLFGSQFPEYVNKLHTVNVTAKFVGLRKASRKSTCSELEAKTAGSNLFKQASLLLCLENVLAVHNIKSWDEFSF